MKQIMAVLIFAGTVLTADTSSSHYEQCVKDCEGWDWGQAYCIRLCKKDHIGIALDCSPWSDPNCIPEPKPPKCPNPWSNPECLLMAEWVSTSLQI